MQRGFVLIEVLIAITVVAITLALGIPGFGAWKRNQEIRGAGEALISGLQLARAEAVRLNTRINFSMDGSSGWTFGCNTVQAGTCPQVIQSRSAQQGSPNAVLIPTNIAAVNDGSGAIARLQFDGTGRIVSGLSDPTAAAWMDISSTTGTCALKGGALRCLRVTAGQYGLLRLCDPQLSKTQATDARAC